MRARHIKIDAERTPRVVAQLARVPDGNSGSHLAALAADDWLHSCSSDGMGLLRGTPDLARQDRKLVGRRQPARDIEVVAASGTRIRDSKGLT